MSSTPRSDDGCNVGEGTLGVAELVEDHVVELITCEGRRLTPQASSLPFAEVRRLCCMEFKLLKSGVRLRVQDGEVEEDGMVRSK